MLPFLVCVLFFLFSFFFRDFFFFCHFRKNVIWNLDDNSTIEDLVVQISEKVLTRFVTIVWLLRK